MPPLVGEPQRTAVFPQEPVRPVGQLSAETFHDYAGEDHVVDARDLRDLLAELSRTEFSEPMSFGNEGCRALISMIDVSFQDLNKSLLLVVSVL